MQWTQAVPDFAPTDCNVIASCDTTRITGALALGVPFCRGLVFVVCVCVINVPPVLSSLRRCGVLERMDALYFPRYGKLRVHASRTAETSLFLCVCPCAQDFAMLPVVAEVALA